MVIQQMNKIWKIKGRSEKISDEALIEMIKSGQLSNDDCIKTSEMKSFIKIEDSIYQFYLRS